LPVDEPAASMIVTAWSQSPECVMDFIERIFGFAPDGGNGVFELLLFIVPIAGIITLALRRRKRAAERRKT